MKRILNLTITDENGKIVHQSKGRCLAGVMISDDGTEKVDEQIFIGNFTAKEVCESVAMVLARIGVQAMGPEQAKYGIPAIASGALSATLESGKPDLGIACGDPDCKVHGHDGAASSPFVSRKEGNA